MASYNLNKMPLDVLDNRDTTHVTVSFDAVSLDEMLAAYEDFLKACGFVFDGHLVIEDEE